MSLFGLVGGPSVEVLFALAGEEKRPKVNIKIAKDKRELVPIYLDGESVSGKVGFPLLSREEGS